MTRRETALQLLIEERDGLTRAINELEVLVTGEKRRGRPQKVEMLTGVEEINTPRKKRSAAARRRMAAAQKARWAKAKGTEEVPTPKKRRMSAAGRKAIAAAQKARWAKAKKQQKSMTAGG